MPWLWLAAAVAFSPSLVDLAGPAIRLPRDRASFVLAAILLLRAALVLRAETPARRQGAVLLLLAVALQLFGIVGDASTLGRMSVGLAIIGVSRFGGRPPLAAALLSLWLVPIPVSVLEPFRAPLENAAAAFVAAVAELLGAPAQAVGPVVRLGAQSLELQVSAAGVQLGHLLSLLGWYAGAMRGETPLRCLRSAALWGACGVALALPCLAAAGAALVGSGPGLARMLLDHALPLLLALAGFVLAEARRPRRE